MFSSATGTQNRTGNRASADVPIHFRFNVDAHTSILTKRFYTRWARGRHHCNLYHTCQRPDADPLYSKDSIGKAIA